MCETILKILGTLDWNTYIGIFIGIAITYVFMARKEKKDLEQIRKDFKKTLCSQFRELRLRLANLSFAEMVESRSVNQKNLKRLCSTLADINDNEDVNTWRELAEKENTGLAKTDKIKDDLGEPRHLNSIRVPALETGVSSLQLLEANHQQSIFSLMTKFDWLNEYIEQYQYLFNELLAHGTTSFGDLQGERVLSAQRNLRLDHAKQIAALSLNILEKMTELLKELSEDA